MRASWLLVPLLLLPASVSAEDPAPGVWLRATWVEASRGAKECDRALRRHEAELRRSLPNQGYRVIRQEVRRARIGERVEFDAGDRQIVDFTPDAVGRHWTQAEMRVRRLSDRGPAREDRRAIRVWHHKAFAVGSQRPDKGSTLLLIETWR